MYFEMYGMCHLFGHGIMLMPLFLLISCSFHMFLPYCIMYSYDSLVSASYYFIICLFLLEIDTNPHLVLSCCLPNLFGVQMDFFSFFSIFRWAIKAPKFFYQVIQP
uniref:Uncharacterized protein n=1 Tax=Spongospora subterranea TaxID=70186 RepID=A0A0H5QWR0_9EUKA|eukprot:CRZ06182.1 hypothetical protein [Spongospora subterranea]